MDKYNGREVVQKVSFNVEGTFESYYAARRWAKDNGFSYGPIDGWNPIAMWHDDSVISKWHNLSEKEKRTCDAIMIGEFREGAVDILIFNAP